MTAPFLQIHLEVGAKSYNENSRESENGQYYLNTKKLTWNIK